MAKLVNKSMISPLFDRVDEPSKHIILVKSLSQSAHYWDITMVIRLSKVALIAATALFLTLIVMNHLTDYHASFQFIKNILSMNSVYLYNQNSWRSITSPVLQHLIYGGMTLWEVLAALLCWGGVYQTWQKLNHITFHQAKFLAIMGLTLSLLIWMFAFIGGQWFLMWQSELWNVQDVVFQRLMLTVAILIFVSLPENSFPKNSSVDVK